MSDRRTRRNELDLFAQDEARFSSAERGMTCSESADVVVGAFGGEVRGYWNADNPTATVARECCDGHDFAITPDRFLVDPWLFHYWAETPVLDLEDGADKATAEMRYGPEEKWECPPAN